MSWVLLNSDTMWTCGCVSSTLLKSEKNKSVMYKFKLKFRSILVKPDPSLVGQSSLQAQPSTYAGQACGCPSLTSMKSMKKGFIVISSCKCYIWHDCNNSVCKTLTSEILFEFIFFMVSYTTLASIFASKNSLSSFVSNKHVLIFLSLGRSLKCLALKTLWGPQFKKNI